MHIYAQVYKYKGYENPSLKVFLYFSFINICAFEFSFVFTNTEIVNMKYIDFMP